MKQAIGGTWLFGIVITFIVFFTTYVSVSTNYSKTFKVKDEILITIEHYRGLNKDARRKIDNYLSDIGYFGEGPCGANDDGSYSRWIGIRKGGSYVGTPTSGRGSYCVRQHIITSYEDRMTGPIGHPTAAYYQVVVFFDLDWPIIKSIFNVRIEGETSIIHQYVDNVTFS